MLSSDMLAAVTPTLTDAQEGGFSEGVLEPPI